MYSLTARHLTGCATASIACRSTSANATASHPSPHLLAVWTRPNLAGLLLAAGETDVLRLDQLSSALHVSFKIQNCFGPAVDV